MNKTILKYLALVLLLTFSACKSDNNTSIKDPTPDDEQPQQRPASFESDSAMLDYIEAPSPRRGWHVNASISMGIIPNMNRT